MVTALPGNCPDDGTDPCSSASVSVTPDLELLRRTPARTERDTTSSSLLRARRAGVDHQAGPGPTSSCRAKLEMKSRRSTAKHETGPPCQDQQVRTSSPQLTTAPGLVCAWCTATSWTGCGSGRSGVGWGARWRLLPPGRGRQRREFIDHTAHHPAGVHDGVRPLSMSTARSS